MDSAQTNDVTHRKPLRLWPGVIDVVVQWIFWIGIPIVAPDYAAFGLLSGIAGGLVVLIWWLFLSKAPWPDRIGALLLMVVAVFAARQIVHVSISNGMMGMLLPFLSIPPLSLALVASAAAGRWLASGARRAVMAAANLLACGVPALLRTDGVTGAGVSDFHWRWTPTAEERLLAQARVEPVPPAPPAAPQRAEEPVTMTPGPPVSTRENSASPSDRPVAPKAVHKPSTAATPTSTAANEAAANGSEWPGFRGPKRDGVIRGVRIETDWSRTPPVELWRRAIGPGWSSFAVHRGLIYTQEQRGEHEVVSCYRLSTGELVWQHRDPVRFYESNGGAGPRATPTVSNGHVYTMGATAIVNALDAATGAVAWSRNAQADTGASMPGWGFAGSPLVVGDAVIVAASGRLVAYEAANGKPRWVRQTGGSGYSSPHLATIDGVSQTSGSLEDGVHLAADTFAKVFGAVGTSLSEVNVDVSGIANLDAYARTLNYLEQMTLVRNIAVEQVSGDTLRLRLAVRGDAETLQRAIALDRRLVPLDAGTDPAPANAANRLALRYQP